MKGGEPGCHVGKGLGIGLRVWQMSGGKRGDVALLELFLVQTDKTKPLGPQPAQKFLFRLSWLASCIILRWALFYFLVICILEKVASSTFASLASLGTISSAHSGSCSS